MSTDPVASPWEPITDPKLLKILGKLGEECNELGAAIFRCIIQGLDEHEPVTGKLNREWLEDEIADVLANITNTAERLQLDGDRMHKRADRKIEYHQPWHDS